MSKDGVALGVIGVGSLGFHHARILRSLPGVRLIGVCDAAPSRLAAVASELEVEPFPDASALLDRVDGAVIAVPTTHHEEVACMALERGVHVLIEKPIAPTLEAADRMLDAARGSGALVQIGHVERFNGALRACEPFLDEPLFVECHRLAPFRPRGTDVAVVLDLMIHDLDLVLSLMRHPVVDIAAVGVPVLTGSPDIANARLQFQNAGVANLTASRVSVEQMRRIRFFQRSGYISLDLAAGRGEFFRLRQEFALTAGEPFAASSLAEIVERIPLESDGVEPLRRELESFIAALRGEEPVIVTGEDGRRALSVALDIIDRIEQHVATSNPA